MKSEEDRKKKINEFRRTKLEEFESADSVRKKEAEAEDSKRQETLINWYAAEKIVLETVQKWFEANRGEL